LADTRPARGFPSVEEKRAEASPTDSL